MTTRKCRQLASRAQTIASMAQQLQKMIEKEFGQKSGLTNDIKITVSNAWEVHDHLKGYIPLIKDRNQRK